MIRDAVNGVFIMSIKIYHSKIKQSGSVLLEAMIAILIISIGILAMVGMQASAINNVSDAKYRSTAGFLADQIVGTMWSQRAVTVNASNVTVASADTTFQCNPCTTGGNAYTQAWAVSGVAAELPQGTASIAMVNTVLGGGSASAVTVTINWQAPKDAVAHKHVVNTYIN
jgi:type IV pilus assembly protein PilV